MYMQEQYTSEYHMIMAQVITEFYYNQSEEELGQTIQANTNAKGAVTSPRLRRGFKLTYVGMW